MYSLEVECVSEFRYAQRPVRISWNEESHRVQNIISETAIQNGWLFEVVTEEGRHYQLKYNQVDDLWLGIEK